MANICGEVLCGAAYVTDIYGVNEGFAGLIAEAGELKAVLTVGGRWLQPNHVVERCETRELSTCVIRLDDEADADLLAVLPRALRFLWRHIRKRSGAVVVHCFAGESRSVAVCVALRLALRVSATPAAALHDIHKVWARARPNEGFMRQLELYSAANAPLQFCLARSGSFHAGCISDEQLHRLINLRRWRRLALISENSDSDQQIVPTQLLALNAGSTPCARGRSRCSGLLQRSPTAIPLAQCRRCRYVLCSRDQGVASVSASTRDAALRPDSSAALRVVPAEWMQGQISGPSRGGRGRLGCPRCDAKVGSFDWRDSFRFHIHSASLDELPLFALFRSSIDAPLQL